MLQQVGILGAIVDFCLPHPPFQGPKCLGSCKGVYQCPFYFIDFGEWEDYRFSEQEWHTTS